MIDVAVWYHKDGDHLVIQRIPWWTHIWNWAADRLCPCHGLTGFLSRWERAETFFYWIWTLMLKVSHDRIKVLYQIPVSNACEISRIIFDPKATCFRDECEYCWEDREDVYSDGSRQMDQV
jgi:hypothetical protein